MTYYLLAGLLATVAGLYVAGILAGCVSGLRASDSECNVNS